MAARWVVERSDGRFLLFWASVTQPTAADESVTPEATIGKGKCQPETLDGTVVDCHLISGKQLTSREFSFSMTPGLTSAQLRLRSAGRRQVVEWEGTGLIDASPILAPCGTDQAIGEASHRSALVSGRIFGQSLEDGDTSTGSEMSEVFALCL